MIDEKNIKETLRVKEALISVKNHFVYINFDFNFFSSDFIFKISSA